MTKPWRFFRAALAVASIVVAAQSCTVKQQNESQDLIGPSGLQTPPGAVAPTPRFTFTPDKPTAFVPVAFDGRSSCPEGGFPGGCIPTDRSIVGFSWDFGDGGTDSGPTVSHTFKTSGPFSVTLTVTSDKGIGSTTTRSVQVDAGTPPKADFVFSPTSPGVGQTVQFNAAQSAGNAGHTISSYAWDFGDGGKASGLTATHTFGNAAGYNVVLTVTDDVGQTGAATKTVNVAATQGPGGPSADWVFSPTDPSVGQSVLFNATQSKAAAGHSIVSYAWNFGDGATGSGVTANHSFSTVGTYAIVLVVTDDLGQTATSSKTVPIKAAGGSPPTAFFVFAPSAPVVGQTVTFSATATPAAGRTIPSSGFAWNFDDGTSPGSVQNPTHTFTTARDFNVRLTVTDDIGQSVAVTNKVTVAPLQPPPGPPTPSFFYSPTSPTNNQPISFDGTASTAATGQSLTTFTWNWGDGTALESGPPSTFAKRTHTFTGIARFKVTLTVIQTDLQSKVGDPQEINVTNGNPTAAFTISPTAPLTFSFDGSGSSAVGPSSIVSYAWAFGDNTFAPPSASKTVSHTYAAPGPYTVTLTVTDTFNRTAVLAQPVTIPTADPTARLSLTKAGGLNITADGSASTAVGNSTIATYSFNWGDNSGSTTGSSSTQPHTFPQPGTYTVVLTVTDNQVPARSATTSQTITVP